MMEFLMDQVETMLKQEKSTYATVDYLAHSYQQKLRTQEERSDGVNRLLSTTEAMTDMDSSAHRKNEGVPSTEEISTSTTATTESSPAITGITELWREKICEWCYQVVDHFDFSREVVSITMDYLDRYLARKTVNKRYFQLAAMASLSLAVKLHSGPNCKVASQSSPTKLSMSSMLALSRGYFTVKQMEAMEMSIMCALDWHLHPPTSLALTKHLLHMLSTPALPHDTRHGLLELARFLNELSVIDYFFVPQRSSHVAVAAIANAIQELAGTVPREAQCAFMELLYSLDLDLQDPAVVACRHRLRLLYIQGGYATPEGDGTSQAQNAAMSDRPTHLASSQPVRPESTPSPVCVSFGTQCYRQEPLNQSAENKDDNDP